MLRRLCVYLAAICAFGAYIVYFLGSASAHSSQVTTTVGSHILPDTAHTTLFAPVCRVSSLLNIACKYQDYTTAPSPEPLTQEVKKILKITGKPSTSTVRRDELLAHAEWLQPNCPDVHKELGDFYKNTGDVETAWEHYLRAALLGSADATELSQAIVMNITNKITQLTTFASKVKGLWDYTLPGGLDINGDDYRAFRRSYVKGTNAIEGNTLTEEQIFNILEDPNWKILNEIPTYEQRETCGAAEAFDYVWSTSSSIGGKPLLTLSFLKEIHRRLMGEISPEEAGNIRDHAVWVNGRKAPLPEYLDGLLAQLVERWASSEFYTLHPLLRAVIAQLEFVWVHPYFDGNGRVGRFLSTAVFQNAGYPPCDLDASVKDEYYNAVTSALPTGGANILPLVRLYCKCLLTSLQCSMNHMETTHGWDLHGVKEIMNGLVKEYW